MKKNNSCHLFLQLLIFGSIYFYLSLISILAEYTIKTNDSFLKSILLLNVTSNDIDRIQYAKRGRKTREALHFHFRINGVASFNNIESLDILRKQLLYHGAQCLLKDEVQQSDHVLKITNSSLIDPTKKFMITRPGIDEGTIWNESLHSSSLPCPDFNQAWFNMSQLLHKSMKQVTQVLERRLNHRYPGPQYEYNLYLRQFKNISHIDFFHAHLPVPFPEQWNNLKKQLKLHTDVGSFICFIAPQSFLINATGHVIPIKNVDPSSTYILHSGQWPYSPKAMYPVKDELTVVAGEGIGDWFGDISQYNIPYHGMYWPPTQIKYPNRVIRVWFGKMIGIPKQIRMKKSQRTFEEYKKNVLNHQLFSKSYYFSDVAGGEEKQNYSASASSHYGSIKKNGTCHVNSCFPKQDERNCHYYCNVQEIGIQHELCQLHCHCIGILHDAGKDCGGFCLQMLPSATCLLKNQQCTDKEMKVNDINLFHWICIPNVVSQEILFQ